MVLRRSFTLGLAGAAISKAALAQMAADIDSSTDQHQGKRMMEFYSPTGPASGRHSSNERGSLRLIRSHPT
jgi:hypothetical protein